MPTVPAAIQTLRIPVRVSPTEYAYVKDAQWVEAPSSLFQRLVADTITARTKIVVLDPRQTTHDPGHRLTGQLLEFGLDAANPSNPVAKVRYDATRSEEHTSELQSLMRISYAVFCLKNKTIITLKRQS